MEKRFCRRLMFGGDNSVQLVEMIICRLTLRACKKNVEEGYVYMVSMDLEKFFDTVNHSKLIEILSRTIKDGRVVSLIHKYLNAGVASKGFYEKTEEGVPQGGLCRARHNEPYDEINVMPS